MKKIELLGERKRKINKTWKEKWCFVLSSLQLCWHILQNDILPIRLKTHVLPTSLLAKRDVLAWLAKYGFGKIWKSPSLQQQKTSLKWWQNKHRQEFEEIECWRKQKRKQRKKCFVGCSTNKKVCVKHYKRRIPRVLFV